MVSLERLKRQLLFWFDVAGNMLALDVKPEQCEHLQFFEFLNLARKHSFRRSGAVNAVGLDRHNDAAADFEEHVGVDAHNTCLIRLGDVGKHAVDHAHEHSVLHRVPRVLDNRDDVRSVRGHVDEISP